MKIVDMTTDALIASLSGATQVATSHDRTQKWVWAGYLAEQVPGDGTAECQELVRRGVLLEDEPEDGFHCFEVAPEWFDRIR